MEDIASFHCNQDVKFFRPVQIQASGHCVEHLSDVQIQKDQKMLWKYQGSVCQSAEGCYTAASGAALCSALGPQALLQQHALQAQAVSKCMATQHDFQVERPLQMSCLDHGAAIIPVQSLGRHPCAGTLTFVSQHQ